MSHARWVMALLHIDGRISARVWCSGPTVPHPILDTIIQCALIAFLTFMTFAFGAVEVWSDLAVVVVVGVLGTLLLLKLVVDRHSRIVWT